MSQLNLLFLDFETQTVDASTTNPTEVGITRIQYDLETSCFTQDASKSWLLYQPDYPPQSEEVVELTGITDELLKAQGQDPREVFPHLGLMIEASDFVFAHKAEFDRVVYESTCARLNIGVSLPRDRWICTLLDAPWPKRLRCKQLMHLAFEYGIPVTPGKAHRTNYDTEVLARLVSVAFKLPDLIAYAKTPWATVFLNGVQGPWVDGGKSNALAKKLGYGWQKCPGTESPEYPKRWCKRLKESELELEKARVPAPFKLTKLNLGEIDANS